MKTLRLFLSMCSGPSAARVASASSFSPPGRRWAPAALWTLRFSQLSRWASRICYTRSASRRLSGTVRSCLLSRICLKLTKQVNASKHVDTGTIFLHYTQDHLLFLLLLHIICSYNWPKPHLDIHTPSVTSIVLPLRMEMWWFGDGFLKWVHFWPCLRPGAAVDSTVSEPEQEAQPTPTPGQSLRLLHLSGQETLVQQSLSQ